MADRGRHHALARPRVHAAIGQRRPHRREIARRDVKRGLPRVQIHRLVRIALDRAQGVEDSGQAAVAVVRLAGGGQHLLVHRQLAPGETRQAVVENAPARRLRRTRREARGGDGAGVDHGVGAPARHPLDALGSVEREAGRIDADTFAHGGDTQRGADEREDEGFGDAHDGEAPVRVPRRVDCAVAAHDAQPEEFGRLAGEGRIDGRDGALVARQEESMRLLQQRTHALRLGQAAGGDVRVVVLAHRCPLVDERA